MALLDLDFHSRAPQLLLAGSAVLLYIASRAVTDALTRSHPESPARRALGAWIPIALVSILALLLNQPHIALSVVFATSVASLSLVSGIVLFSATGQPQPVPTRFARIWLMLLPAAILALLAGFNGQLRPLHALALITQGLILLPLWFDLTTHPTPNDTTPPNPPATPSASKPLLNIQLLLAILLAILGAWGATRGAVHLAGQLRVNAIGVLAATLLNPVLTLPMIAHGFTHTTRNQSWNALTAHTGVVFLNLCLLIPLLLALWLLGLSIPENPPFQLTLAPDLTRALPYPLAIWRVDSVILVIFSLAYVPLSLARWIPSRLEGLALIAAYCLYVVLVIIAGAA